jgi:hypothetical protein
MKQNKGGEGLQSRVVPEGVDFCFGFGLVLIGFL